MPPRVHADLPRVMHNMVRERDGCWRNSKSWLWGLGVSLSRGLPGCPVAELPSCPVVGFIIVLNRSRLQNLGNSATRQPGNPETPRPRDPETYLTVARYGRFPNRPSISRP